MADDGPERTTDEREEARRARERRRSGVFGEADGHEPFVNFADNSADGDHTRRDGVPAPGTAGSKPVEEDAGWADDGDSGEALGWPDEDDDGEDAVADGASAPLFDPHERPSGTRRVSRVPPTTRRRGRRSAAAPARPTASRAPRRGTPPPRRPRTAPARSGAAAGGRRSHAWIGGIVGLVLLVIVAGAAWFASQLFQLFGTSPHGRVTVVVPGHTGARQIGNLLAREGVVPSGFFFNLRAELAGDRGKLLSGTYHLEKGMTYSAALTALMTPPPVAKTTQVTIIPGHARGQVAKLLRKAGVRGNYMAATRSSPVLNPRSYGAPAGTHTLEGFLFPDTFRVLAPAKAKAVVADQLRDFKQHVSGINFSYARRKHLTPYDVLKIASLIEGEAADAHDRPLIASVIYNRLADNMMLQFDSTTRYATGNWTGPITVSQLASPSPYNTRTHLGLPPTPINSPSLASIKAAAHPAKTNYLYFFTKPCNAGTTVYTSTYTQFLNLLAADRRDHCP